MSKEAYDFSLDEATDSDDDEEQGEVELPTYFLINNVVCGLVIA